MTVRSTDKVSARKMMSQSKPGNISIFRVNQTDSKSAAAALGSIKSEIAKAKCDLEILVIRK